MTTIKERDNLARRHADQSARLAAARADLDDAEAAWQQAIAQDGNLEAAGVKRADAQAKVAAAGEVVDHLGRLLADVEAQLTADRARGDYAAAVRRLAAARTHREQLAQDLPARVDVAINGVLDIVDQLRADVATFHAAVEDEVGAVSVASECAQAVGATPPAVVPGNLSDELARALPDDPARLAFISASRADTLGQLARAASMRGLARAALATDHPARVMRAHLGGNLPVGAGWPTITPLN